MSTYEHDLAARFAALAPRALPGDWDDVLDRAGAVRPRRRRLARSSWRVGRGRKLVVVLAVAVLVAALAAAAFGTVRVLILDKGFIGLPPVGATPSAPESGELVLRWSGRSAVHIGPRGMPFVHVFVYADGRVIWHREGHVPEGANELTSGYLEQRLTSDGVDLLRSELVATGLFERNSKLFFPGWTEEIPVPRTRAGEPVNCPHEADVRRGDRVVRLRCNPYYAPPSPGGSPVTEEQLEALRRVDALLTDAASALPPSAWAVRKIRAYVPSHFAVCLATPLRADTPRSILSLLPARAEELLRDRSWTGSKELGRTLGRTVAYCSKVATDDAREIADAVSGLERHPWAESLIYDVPKGAKDGEETTISFDPYFPHGEFLLYDGGR